MSARFHTVGPLLSGEGSRAFLAIAIPASATAPLEPRVIVWLHEDVVRDPDAMLAVRRETRRAIQLEHPNIVRVFGLMEIPEGIARVVEYADAESLRQVLRQAGTLTPALAARIVADAAMGVHYAHLAGNDDGTPLIHGDLRPETVMLGYAGATKVGGYAGLAAAPREPAGRRVQGRRQHCAPEQVVGGREALNIQTDVYLLGVLLYELLSGRVPYAELPPAEFDGAVLTHPPPPLPVGERPPELEAVLRRAMAKKAFDRYPTALAFREAVERAMGDAIATQGDVAVLVQRFFPESAPDSPRATRRKLIVEAIAQLRRERAVPAPGSATSAGSAISAATSAGSVSSTAVSAGPSTPDGRPTSAGSATSASPLSTGSRSVPGAPPAPRGPAEPTVSTPPLPDYRPPPASARQPPSSLPPERRALGSLFATGLVVGLTAVGLWAWQSGHLEEVLPLAEAPSMADGGEVTAAPDAGGVADPGALGAVIDAGTTDSGVRLGVLELIVDPPVQVSVDGVPMGRAPRRLELEPGRRVLQLVDRRRLIDLTRVVDVPEPPAVVRREFYLSRGFVRVVAPDGAEVFVDGRSFGKAPIKELGLYEGTHQLRVHIGEARWQETFSLKPNERIRFDVDLQ